MPVTKSGDTAGVEPAVSAGVNVTLVAARGGQFAPTPVHSPVPPSGRSSSVPRRAVLQGDPECSFRADQGRRASTALTLSSRPTLRRRLRRRLRAVRMRERADELGG